MSKLQNIITPEKLIEMGFVREDDGSGDPRGVDYNIRNNKFHLMVDPWFDIKLRRIDTDSDFISVNCGSISDLEDLIEWIKD